MLDAHGVEYVLVGGLAATAHGASRPTDDFDCLANRQPDTLDRLASAMRELHARLRVEGLSDEESVALPVVLDRHFLNTSELSTWRTDAGDFDVLADIPARDGHRLRYDELIKRAQVQEVHGIAVRVAALPDVIASKEWADRPKDRQALPELRQLQAARPNPNPTIDKLNQLKRRRPDPGRGLSR